MKKLLLTIAFIACFVSLSAQTYLPPADLSPIDIASWTIRGGFIASGTVAPTGIASAGCIYVDTIEGAIWRYSGSAWQQIGGAGLKEHIASQTDPHGASMTVTQDITIGDPETAMQAKIDSPAAGQARIASYVVLIPLASAPAVVDGGIYKSTDGHFYGSNGSSWLRLDN